MLSEPQRRATMVCRLSDQGTLSMLTYVTSLAQYQIQRWGLVVLEFTQISKPMEVADENLRCFVEGRSTRSDRSVSWG